jgi:23S rRNA (uracil1939-C5)-methyltransferase
MAEVLSDLAITALVHGGRGLGHCDGKAIFVPLTVPGDRVSCRVIKSKRRYVESELLGIIEPSPLRREPPCPFFGSCGGCQWQHISYAGQAHWKNKIFSDLMVRSQLLSADCLRPIAVAPDEWRYRNRIQLKCHSSAAGLAVGFYRQGSHSIVEVDKCLLVAPPIQMALDLLRSELSDVPCYEYIKQIDLSCGDGGEVRLLFHVKPEGLQSLRIWLQAFARHHQLNACLLSTLMESPEIVHGEADLTVLVDQPALVLRYGPGGFVQVNSEQNRRMVATMLELLELKGTESVLDLFCGMGNFSLPLARRVGRVSGVEDYAPSIAKARINAEANNINNAEFYAADATAMLSRYGTVGRPDLIVIDPPRTGNYPISLELLKVQPTRILYVSCDPATLVRDLTPLVQGGYDIVASQPFDLFPQTWHIESMTLLQRRKS